MKYATFWQRLVAALIDSALILAMLVFVVWLESISRLVAVALIVPAALLFCAYPIYFHGRFGQTIGKHVTRIKLVQVSGHPIGWREAWLRSSVDILFYVLTCAAQFIALTSISDLEYSSAAGWMGRAQLVQAHQPNGLDWLVIASNAWVWSELLTMLSNKRRRALHDFIAGTVVVQIESSTQPSRAAA